MSFQQKLRQEGYNSRGLKKTRTNQVVIDDENDFPFTKVDFVRVGSAHAEERYERRDMIRATESVARMIEAKYEPARPPSPVVVDLK